METVKLYYTISEVAEMLKLNQSVLRYWETEFSHIQPRKTKKGDRLYMQKDIDDIRLIYHLLKEKGYTIEGAKKYLKEKKTSKASPSILQSLLAIRQQLEQIQKTIS